MVFPLQGLAQVVAGLCDGETELVVEVLDAAHIPHDLSPQQPRDHQHAQQGGVGSQRQIVIQGLGQQQQVVHADGQVEHEAEAERDVGWRACLQRAQWKQQADQSAKTEHQQPDGLAQRHLCIGHRQGEYSAEAAYAGQRTLQPHEA